MKKGKDNVYLFTNVDSGLTDTLIISPPKVSNSVPSKQIEI